MEVEQEQLAFLSVVGDWSRLDCCGRLCCGAEQHGAMHKHGVAPSKPLASSIRSQTLKRTQRSAVASGQWRLDTCSAISILFTGSQHGRGPRVLLVLGRHHDIHVMDWTRLESAVSLRLSDSERPTIPMECSSAAHAVLLPPRLPCSSAAHAVLLPPRLPCSSAAHVVLLPPRLRPTQRGGGRQSNRIEMRDRGKNRKPTQRGRYLSSEAILAVQCLKRAQLSPRQDQDQDRPSWDRVRQQLRRLIKRDLLAVMRELLSQDQPLLALLVFQEIRKEHWYRPHLSLYLDLISLLARLGLKNELHQTCSSLKREHYLQADTEGFNLLFRVLLDFGFVHLALDCFRLMKLWQCHPDQDTYRIFIPKLASVGELDVSRSLQIEAKKQYGTSFDVLQLEQNMVQPSHTLPSVF